MWLLISIITVLLIIKLYNRLSSGWCYSRKIMTGKVVVVTGANSGIGFETALNLAKRGAKVILACRDEGKGRDTAEDIVSRTKNKSVVHKVLDLSSFKSIRLFVEDLKSSEARLDVLINNAGMGGFQDTKTDDGLVYDLQANHLGPFLLTTLLIPLLKKSEAARVINVSSLAHILGDIHFDTINKERYGLIDPFRVYCNNKLCNLLFTYELSRRLLDTDITVNALHPGMVRTSIYKNVKIQIFATFLNIVMSTFCKTALDGAQTSIFLAVSDEVEGATGKYFVDCRESWTSAKAKDGELAKRLWEYSERVTELGPDEML